MKVLICGGRKYNNRARIEAALAVVASTTGKVATHMIHGGASGADQCASDIARMHGLQEVICPANWNIHGRMAGPLRNAKMIELQPDLVIAAPGGRGTADCVQRAKDAGIPVLEIKDE